MILVFLAACSTETQEFRITGEWRIFRADHGSGQGFDRSAGVVWVFAGNREEGEISAAVSFLNGTYRVRGRAVDMEVVSGRGPLWFRTEYEGIVTGDDSMQGRYEGREISSNSETGGAYSGTWWAIRQK